MKIALIIEKFDPAAGGRERSTLQIAAELLARGHDVTILCRHAVAHAADLLPAARFLISAGPDTKFALGLWLFRRWTLKQLDTGSFDASISMSSALPATLVQPRDGTVRQTLARKLQSRSGLRRLTTQLSIILRPKLLTWLYLEHRTVNDPRVRRFVAISRYVADQLYHHYTLSSRHVTLIPNAAHIQPLDEAARAHHRLALRKALSLSPTDTVFLFIAMDYHRKGLAPLLHAMARLRTQCPSARLIIVGPLDAAWQQRAAALHLSDILRWTGPTRHIDPLYAAADAAVLPSWYDPASKVVLESLLHHLPVIGSIHDGSAQWIHSPTGSSPIPSPFDDPSPAHPGHDRIEQPAGRIITSPGDIDALTQSMLDLSDPQERARCVDAIHQANLPQKISMKRHVDDLLSLLEELAHPKPGQSAAPSRISPR
jgi:glycosyltransferase involved in cell wall biosynthesis